MTPLPPAVPPATAAPTPRRWSFGPAVLDERTQELLVDGTPVDVERKPLEVLTYLLERAGEVVTKDELAEALWPGRILTETVLTRCISQLRLALRDETRALIKTVHGYGYRLAAPVCVDRLEAPALPAQLEFKPGDRVPLRPHFRIERRLGRGGHGEVWLARHENTHEARVYKYALAGPALTALKREVTLYRFLRDALGERPDLARIIDWNLRDAPCFLESEYAGGGSLLDWAEAQGGLAAVPLPARLDLLAQMAEALAAAHAIGVLHKDLKPANALVVCEPGQAPRIQLTDFGSGGVLDPAQLDAMGITRMGLTRALGAGELTSSTPLYLAPEVMAGQPSTVQADIYALGVMLYQLCIGDFSRPLASGWEHDVADELLREDIALAADGNPARRLADAGALAQRLRSLEQRRARAAAGREAQAGLARAQREAETSRQAMERLRARRSWMIAAAAILVVGLGATTGLYLHARTARIDAERSALTTLAVSDFLNADVLSGGDPARAPSRDLKLREVLDRAAESVDRRLADQPEAAARVHDTLGQAYQNLLLSLPAYEQFRKAQALNERLYPPGAEALLAGLGRLATAVPDTMDAGPDCTRLGEAVAHPVLAGDNLVLLRARADFGWCQFGGDGVEPAVAELRAVAALAAGAGPGGEPLLDLTRRRLGFALGDLAEFDEAEAIIRQVLATRERKYGPAHYLTAMARLNLGYLLTDHGASAAADASLARGFQDLRAWAGDDSVPALEFRWALGHLRLQQGRLDEAVALLDQALQRNLAIYGADSEDTARFSWDLGEAYQRQGRLDEAERSLRSALAILQKPGRPRRYAIHAGALLADCLREQGRYGPARAVLAQVSALDESSLPKDGLILADLRRVEGLLWRHEGNAERSRAALAESSRIYARRLGSQHWRTQRVLRELAAA